MERWIRDGWIDRCIDVIYFISLFSSPAERQTSVDSLLHRSPGSALNSSLSGRTSLTRLLSHPSGWAEPIHLDLGGKEVSN